MRRYSFLLAGLVAGLPLVLGVPTQAQNLVPDGSLGSTFSQVNVNRQLIENGTLMGGNLFHSFSEFNVPQFKEVYFANPAAVGNILTRVTGTNGSDILGKLGVRIVD